MTVNNQAKLLNERLGVKIYNESITNKLERHIFTTHEIAKYFIDDLILDDNSPTSRLIRFTNEILNEEN